MENIQNKENVEKKVKPEDNAAIEKKLGTTSTKVESKVDTTSLKQEVNQEMNQEQLAIKNELERDLASGMKVSETVGKRSTRLDSMDKWLTILPFIGDAMTWSAGLLFFMAQNKQLSEKYKLPMGDKFKAAMLQVGDRTFETLLKSPISMIQSIPIVWALTLPITEPVKAWIWWVSDSIFKANKWTAKLFEKQFEQMLKDANTWNKENPDKEQIDVQSMKSEMEENMKKLKTKLDTKNVKQEKKELKKKEKTEKENEKLSKKSEKVEKKEAKIEKVKQ